jgi:hypothetical protein
MSFVSLSEDADERYQESRYLHFSTNPYKQERDTCFDKPTAEVTLRGNRPASAVATFRANRPARALCDSPKKPKKCKKPKKSKSPKISKMKVQLQCPECGISVRRIARHLANVHAKVYVEPICVIEGIVVPKDLLGVVYARKSQQGEAWSLRTRGGVKFGTFTSESALDNWWRIFQESQGRQSRTPKKVAGFLPDSSEISNRQDSNLQENNRAFRPLIGLRRT